MHAVIHKCTGIFGLFQIAPLKYGTVNILVPQMVCLYFIAKTYSFQQQKAFELPFIG